MTRVPRYEDVLGPLAAVIVREVVARGEASVADVVDGSGAHLDGYTGSIWCVLGNG